MKTCTLMALALALACLPGCELEVGNGRIVGQLASDRIELSAEVAEPIVEIRVHEGETVAAGDIIVRQDPARGEARLAEAEAMHAEAKARLDELVRGPRSEQISAARANLEGAKRELDFRRTEFRRTLDVHEKGLAAADQLDAAQAALDSAEANLALREAQLEELLSGTTVEELAQAEAAVRGAAARVRLARTELERHTLRSPVDGIADTRLLEVGERPRPGQPVFVVLADSQPYARIYVPESLRAEVRPGTAARVFADGIDTPIAGRVRWISAEAAFTPYFALTEHDRGRLTWLAKIDLEREGERLPDGLPVEVELETGDAAR